MIITPVIKSWMSVKITDNIDVNGGGFEMMCEKELIGNLIRQLNRMKDKRSYSDGLQVNMELAKMSSRENPKKLETIYSMTARCFIENWKNARVGEAARDIPRRPQPAGSRWVRWGGNRSGFVRMR